MSQEIIDYENSFETMVNIAQVGQILFPIMGAIFLGLTIYYFVKYKNNKENKKNKKLAILFLILLILMVVMFFVFLAILMNMYMNSFVLEAQYM